jgi:hypothetical protein
LLTVLFDLLRQFLMAGGDRAHCPLSACWGILDERENLARV